MVQENLKRYLVSNDNFLILCHVSLFSSDSRILLISVQMLYFVSSTVCVFLNATAYISKLHRVSKRVPP